MDAWGKVRRVAPVVVLIATSAGLALSHDIPAGAVGTSPLTNGSTTMVSTLANGTSVPIDPTLAGANEVAITDDGKLVAFTSSVPAPELVTDPAQVGHVIDNNTAITSGGIAAGLDVFVYDARGSAGPIISLVSWNAARNGTGDAPSDTPVMAPKGVGLVFGSSATDLVAGHVDANQRHLYAWVPGLGAPNSLFLVDTKFSTSDACNCAATNPSISLSGPLGPTVVFQATGGGSNDLVGPSVLGQAEDQIYAHAIVTNTNTLVSATNNSHVPNDRSTTDPDVGNGVIGGAGEPMIAADAPIVVFTANGNDLVDGFDTSNGSNVWERNLVTGATILVSASSSGDPDGTFGNERPVISSDGAALAWSSNDQDVSATPWSPPQQNASANHIFYRRVLPTAQPTLMVDTDWTGAIGCDAISNDAAISGDGRMVVFDSGCDDITRATETTDSNGASDVFERVFAPIPDVAPQLLSINDAGTATGNGGSELCGPVSGSFATACSSLTDPSVTVNFDGTVVSYFSTASDVATVPNPPPPRFDNGNVIVNYHQTPTTFQRKNANATVSLTGENPVGTSGAPVISADGDTVAFVSFADDLVAGDVNGQGDAFITSIFHLRNHSPVCADLSLTIAQDTTGSVAASCTDAENDPLDYAITAQGTKGTASAVGGYLQYVPNAGATGSDSFKYVSGDTHTTSNAATVSVTINPAAVNHAPACAARSLTTAQDTPGTVAPSCTDADGDPLTYKIVAQGTKGTASVLSGNLQYVPNAGATGTDSFTYTANDGHTDGNAATVSVTITPGNHAPVCAARSLTTAQDTTGSVAPSCTDADSDTLSYKIVTQGTKGTASVVAGNLNYVPNAGATGTDSFTYTANDGHTDGNAATVSVTITPVNHAPVCAVRSLTTAQDTPGSVAPSCTDAESDALSYKIVTQGTKGTASVVAGNLHYVPRSGASGSDSFTYTANDGHTDGNRATVSVAIIQPADLAVTVSGAPAQGRVGGLVLYAVTVHNNGPGTAASVKLVDQLSPFATPLTTVTAPGGVGCVTTSSTVTCNASAMASKNTFVVLVLVRINHTGQLTNAATVTSATPDSVPANNSKSVMTTAH